MSKRGMTQDHNFTRQEFRARADTLGLYIINKLCDGDFKFDLRGLVTLEWLDSYYQKIKKGGGVLKINYCK